MFVNTGQFPSDELKNQRFNQFKDSLSKRMLELDTTDFYPADLCRLLEKDANCGHHFYKEDIIAICPDESATEDVNIVQTELQNYRVHACTREIINQLSLKSTGYQFEPTVRRAIGATYGKPKLRVSYANGSYSLIMLGRAKDRNYPCFNPAYIKNVSEEGYDTVIESTLDFKLKLPISKKTFDRYANRCFEIHSLYAMQDFQRDMHPEDPLWFQLGLPETPYIRKSTEKCQPPQDHGSLAENLKAVVKEEEGRKEV